MTESMYPKQLKKKVLDTIKHHNFLTKYQRSLESKILFDADKLDALSPIRYNRIIAGIKSKKLSSIQIFLLAKAAKLWLKTMRGRYHFEKSREIHDELIENLLHDQDTLQVAKEWGVEIEKLVQ